MITFSRTDPGGASPDCRVTPLRRLRKWRGRLGWFSSITLSSIVHQHTHIDLACSQYQVLQNCGNMIHTELGNLLCLSLIIISGRIFYTESYLWIPTRCMSRCISSYWCLNVCMFILMYCIVCTLFAGLFTWLISIFVLIFMINVKKLP